MAFEPPATGLQQGERSQVSYGGQGTWIDLRRFSQGSHFRRVLPHCGRE
jgi:hypothetical protein